MENVSRAGPKEYRSEWHYGEFLIGMEQSAQVFLKLELDSGLSSEVRKSSHTTMPNCLPSMVLPKCVADWCCCLGETWFFRGLQQPSLSLEVGLCSLCFLGSSCNPGKVFRLEKLKSWEMTICIWIDLQMQVGIMFSLAVGIQDAASFHVGNLLGIRTLSVF